MALLNTILGVRRDPRVLKLPPYLSAICIIVGVVWLAVLPLPEYSRRTYISENAILPGQVHTYFGGSEHNIFRAYRHEVSMMEDLPVEERSERLGQILLSSNLKVATQKYEYHVSGRNITGQNVYAVLQGPRADATEAIVLIASWTTLDGEVNYSGVALALTLARYFKRWSLWSKDIIILISGDSTTGPQAWVDAYHDSTVQPSIEPLAIKSGALQGAIAIEYPAGPWGHRFDKLHIRYDGTNGQLPNLDLFNTAVSIANGQMGIGCTLQRMWNHDDTYKERLQTILRGMVNQGLGHATGPHSAFIPYHVDAITLQTVGDGWHDEMSLGRTVESMFRSLNNLLEHLHQSFFFYLLMQANRFVSIGTYLPSAMLIAVNFTITSIALWVASGRPPTKPSPKVGSTDEKAIADEPDMTVVKHDGMSAIVPAETFAIVERHLFLPVAFVTGAHFLGLLPLYIFNNAPANILPETFHTFTAVSLLLPPLTASAIHRLFPSHPTTQETTLIQTLSLLLLGMTLSCLATLNFSLSFLIGLLASPLSFVRRRPSALATALQILVLAAVHPTVLIALAARFAGEHWVGIGLRTLLVKAAEGWHVWSLWTPVVVWLVWWPAWLAGAVVVCCGLF